MTVPFYLPCFEKLAHRLFDIGSHRRLASGFMLTPAAAMPRL